MKQRASQPAHIDDPDARRLTRRVVTIAAVVVLVLVTATVLASRGKAPDSTVVASQEGSREAADGDDSPDALTRAESDALWDEAMELHEQGWDRYGVHPIIDGTPVPDVAFVEAQWEFPEPEFRAPVYDAPDGNQIGWHYSHLGFLTLEQAADGIFDAATARVEKYGCDIQLDIDCRQGVIADAESPG